MSNSYQKIKYKNSSAIDNKWIKLSLLNRINWMANLALETSFWLILLIYIIARLTLTKKRYKQQY